MKATIFSWLAVCGLSVGLSPLAAWADDAADGPQPAELFETLDKNSDGKIAADEVGEERAKFFNRLVRVGDEDKDGLLSKAEFVNATKPEAQPVATADETDKPERKNKKNAAGRDPKKLFGRLDKNSDGKVAKDEIPEKQQKRFDRIFTRLGKDELTLEDFEKFAGKGKGEGDKTAAKKKAKGKKKPAGESEKPADATATAEKGPGDKPEGRPDPEQMFKRFDANEDGKLTVDEVPEGFKERLTAMLKRAGKDEDGSVNLNEFKRVAGAGREDGDGRGRRGEGGRFGGPPRPPEFFTKLDANDDRKLSKEELTKIFELFDELDKDKDGMLDGPELLGFPGRGGPDGGRSMFGRPDRGRRPEGGDAGRRRPGGMFLERLDKDKDGKVSKEEAGERLKDRFDSMDKNSDGYLEGDELRFGRPDGPQGPGRGRRGRGESKDQSPEKSDEKPADAADGKDA